MGNEFKGQAPHSAEHFGGTRDHWSEADARRLYLAGGGSEDDFTAHFAGGLTNRESIVRGLDDATFHGIIGGGLYLVAGRKPGKGA